MSLPKKLLYKPGYRICVVNAPEHFSFAKDELPEQVAIVTDLDANLDSVLLFAPSQEELSLHAARVLASLKDDGLLWVAYPKKSSKIKTDIHRDAGWDVLNELKYFGVSLISIDDTWSAMRFRHEKYIKSLQTK